MAQLSFRIVSLLRPTKDKSSRHRGSKGQSFVEFAIVLPVILFLTMAALDFGRVYLGWINLQNMVRAAANFAANNPNAWLIPNDTAAITRYQNQVRNDAAASNCQLDPATPAPPTFADTNGDSSATGIGDFATVTMTCKFSIITPIISAVLGGTVDVSAAAVFPVKNGITGTGSGTGCILPVPAINANPTSGNAPLDVTFSDASGGGTGTAWHWVFGDGTADSTAQNPGVHKYTLAGSYPVTLEVTNACGTVITNPGITINVGSASGLCTVPTLDGHIRSDAQALWGLPSPPGAGFTTTVQNADHVPNNNGWTIKSQSIVAGSQVDCGSTITVDNN